MNVDVLVPELIEQLKIVLGAALGSPVETETAAAPGKAWTLHINAADVPELTLAFGEPGVGDLVRAMTGQDQPTLEATRDAMRDLCHQAVTAALTKLSLAVDDPVDIHGPELEEWRPSANEVSTRFASASLSSVLVVTVAAEDVPATQAQAGRRDLRADDDTPANTAERLDVLLDIDLPLVVRFGCTQLPLKTLSRLSPGSLIDLSRAPDDPVEMLVGDRVVAHGEVVVVSGSYGIRITDVVSGRDNARGVNG